MTGIQIYAFIVLPLSIAAVGSAYAYFFVKSEERKRKLPPAE